MKRILLCPPDYFDIEYEINPWMHTTNKVNHSKVHAVYKKIKELYESLRVEVHEIPPIKGLPDMVFPSNFGQVSGNTFIKANFRYKERRPEAEHAQAYFENEFGMTTKTLPEGIFFEGQGDLLNDGERFFFGWGKRSMQEAKPYLEKYLGVPVIDFELVNPYYYHLDTAFAPITSDLVIYNPQSFTPEGKEKIFANFTNVIEANEQDNKVIGCNLVIIDKHIVVSSGISESLRTKLINIGYMVHEFDMSEYIKSGGSVKCVSFWF